jgi:hypothetical protein
MVNKLKMLINGRNVIVTLGLYYSFFVLFYLPVSPVSGVVLKNITIEQVPDLQKNGYSTEQVEKFINICGDKGRTDYLRNLWTLDLIFPLLSAVSTLLLMLYCLKRIGLMKRLGLIVLVPVVVMMADYAENIFITIIMSNYPNRMEGLVFISSICTRIKWIGINVGFIVNVILVIAFLVSIVIGCMRNRKSIRRHS